VLLYVPAKAEDFHVKAKRWM